MARKETVESRSVKAILQEEESITIGAKTYMVAPPSLGTIMRVSALVSQMSKVDQGAENPITEALRVADNALIVAEVIATIIIGAKRIRESKKALFGGKKTELEELTDAILFEKEPSELKEMLSDFLFNRMDLGFFLGITISLNEVNMIKPTKTDQTAPGQ